MKLLLVLLCLAGCGKEFPYLLEGVYYVQLIETSNSCEWANGDTGEMAWKIISIDDRYGITHQGNQETIACQQDQHSGAIQCSKEKDTWIGYCKYHVTQEVVLEPQEDMFTGTFVVGFHSCVGETCGQEALIEGSYFYP